MRHFQPARLGGLGAPETEELAPTASASFPLGAPVRRNSSNSNEVEEHPGGATVVGILGVTAQSCASGVPAFGSKVQVHLANDQIGFVGEVYDVSASGVATVAGDGTYLGNSYGFVKAGGNWYVDEEDTSNVVLTVVKELPEVNAVLFKFIASAVAL